jgi:hypothetical protein
VTDVRAEAAGATGSGGHPTQGAGGASGATSTSGTGAGGGSLGGNRVITADTDGDRLVTGVIPAITNKLVDGPFVLTDACGEGGLGLYLVHATGCSAQSAGQAVTVGGGARESHGMRVFVPSGWVLCNGYSGSGTFSGFRPY